jgi:hypothetical protein
MSEVRQPSVYVHGVDNDGRPTPICIIPGRSAAYLENYAGLDEYRIANRGTDPDVDNVLMALHQVALAWRGAATGTRQAVKPAPDAPLFMSTTQAAIQTQRGERAIRKACTEGRLKAHQLNGRWQISREDIAHYKATQGAKP